MTGAQVRRIRKRLRLTQVQLANGDVLVYGPLVRFTTDPDEGCLVEYYMVPDHTNDDFSTNPPFFGYKLCATGNAIRSPT